MLFHFKFEDDLGAEQAFCRFGICDTVQALKMLQSQYGNDVASVPPSELARFLRRDPGGTYRWCDLGESLQKAGRITEARYCFSKALALGPRIPFTLLRAAQFTFKAGQNGDAVALLVRALDGNPDYDEAAFSEYERRSIGVAEILRSGLPSNSGVWRSFLHWQMAHDRPAEAGAVWRALVLRGYEDDKLAHEYVEFLIRNGKTEAAAAGWALYARRRDKDYPDLNLIFNGDFELAPTGARFDWAIEQIPGATIDFDSQTAHSGSRSLRAQFDGRQNVANIGVQQTIFLNPGLYQFQAYARAEGLSTDEGVAFRVASQSAPNRLYFTTEAVRGTTDWKLVKYTFQAPPGTGLVEVRLVRTPSLRFDNLIRGTLWIDEVSIRPEAAGVTSGDRAATGRSGG